MMTNENNKVEFADRINQLLVKEPGLSVKELAEKLKTNRQFMAGVLRVLEERREVSYRQVGPARIYYATNTSKEEYSSAR